MRSEISRRGFMSPFCEGLNGTVIYPTGLETKNLKYGRSNVA
jgi:hypothetical protein